MSAYEDDEEEARLGSEDGNMCCYLMRQYILLPYNPDDRVLHNASSHDQTQIALLMVMMLRMR